MSDAQVTEGEGHSATQSDAGGNAASQNGTVGNQQNNQQSQPHNQPPQHSNTPDLTAVLTSLAALPEQIARSVKEAVGTPVSPQSSGTEQKTETGKNGQDSASSGDKESDKTTETKTATPGKSKSFGDWWFGR